jgi:hypothetical protein
MDRRFELVATAAGRPWPKWLFTLVGRVLLIAGLVATWSAALAAGLEGPALLALPTVAFLALMAGVAWLVAAWRRVDLTIGADGVQVDRFRSKKFYRHAEISAKYDGGDRLHLVVPDAAEPLFLHVAASGLSLQKVAAELERARRLSGGGNGPRLETLLGRGGRTTHDWVRDLRTLRAGGGYRDEDVGAEHLWDVLEDPTLEAAPRAAAAVALRDQLDDAGKARVRVAADACASPKVQVALQAAADGTDEDLAEAMEVIGRAEGGNPPVTA